jgi:hypothetical protein
MRDELERVTRREEERARKEEEEREVKEEQRRLIADLRREVEEGRLRMKETETRREGEGEWVDEGRTGEGEGEEGRLVDRVWSMDWAELMASRDKLRRMGEEMTQQRSMANERLMMYAQHRHR